MYFQWKDAYSVNVREFDEQHRKLFEIGSRISDLATAKDNFDHYDEIMDILGELGQYTQYHFEYEEKRMEQYGYPDMDTHMIEHTFAIKKIQKMAGKDIDLRQKEALMELITFVSDWISGHILKTDLKYKPFFNEKGVE